MSNIRIIVSNEALKASIIEQSQYVHDIQGIDGDLAGILMHLYTVPEIIEVKEGSSKFFDLPRTEQYEKLSGKTKDVKEWILCSAIIYKSQIVTGRRHSDCYATLKFFNVQDEDMPGRDMQGFLTSTGRFVNRLDAWQIAKTANQIKLGLAVSDFGEATQLISENLYDDLEETVRHDAEQRRLVSAISKAADMISRQALRGSESFIGQKNSGDTRARLKSQMTEAIGIPKQFHGHMHETPLRSLFIDVNKEFIPMFNDNFIKQWRKNSNASLEAKVSNNMHSQVISTLTHEDLQEYDVKIPLKDGRILLSNGNGFRKYVKDTNDVITAVTEAYWNRAKTHRIDLNKRKC